MTTGTLNIRALRAEFSKDFSHFGTQDPYCVLIVGNQELASEVDKHGGKNPVWNELFHLDVTGNEYMLFARIYSREHIAKDKIIGQGTVEIHSLIRPDKINLWIELRNLDNLIVGKVLLQSEFAPLIGDNPIIESEEKVTIEAISRKILEKYDAYLQTLKEKGQQVFISQKEVISDLKDKIIDKVGEITEKTSEKIIDKQQQVIEQAEIKEHAVVQPVKIDTVSNAIVAEASAGSATLQDVIPKEPHALNVPSVQVIHETLPQTHPSVADQIKGKVVDIKDQASEMVSDLRERIHDKIEDFKDSARESKAEVNSQINDSGRHPQNVPSSVIVTKIEENVVLTPSSTNSSKYEEINRAANEYRAEFDKFGSTKNIQTPVIVQHNITVIENVPFELNASTTDSPALDLREVTTPLIASTHVPEASLKFENKFNDTK